ncbi:MAG: polyphosphate kinase, partial [Sphingomonadales bacterium]|nr:polyphosphate kinase [Sphingomonadales bacterium]
MTDSGFATNVDSEAAPSFDFPPRERYFNRELSWLAFNRRVLDEACNPAHPLLERLRFLSISGNNLDEFFMVRVAGLKAHRLLGVEETSVDGLTPAQQLAAVADEADRLTASQQAVWAELKAALASEGLRVIGGETLDGDAEAFLERHFREQVFPVLTPQALDPAHPFPFIPNRGFSLLFDLERPGGGTIRELLMVPTTLPRFVRIPGAEARFIAVETLIRRNIATLFPGSALVGEGAFRIIRDSDIEVEEEAEDLVRYFRSAIKRRRRGRVI